MTELRRILCNRRRSMILLALPLLCLGLFLYEKCGGRFDMLKSGAEEYRALLRQYEGESPQEIAEALERKDPLTIPTEEETRLKEQAAYVRDYAAYLENVQTQAKQQKNSPVFGKNKNSYVYRNILKTAGDFEPMIGTEVSLGNDRALESWLAFSGADFFFLAAMLLIALSFFDERKCGLQAVVRSCPGGRAALGLRRCGVLLFFSVLYTLLLYGLPLVCAFLIDGSSDLSRPVQSLVSFKKCTIPISIAGWLVRMLFVRVLCGFLLGLIIWFFLSFLKQLQLTWLLTAAAFIIEYVLYRTILVQSVFSPLKLINVFAYIHASKLYTDYVNLNVFGWPVGSRLLLLLLLRLFTLLLTAANVLLQSRRYPFGGRDILGKAVLLGNRVGDAFRRHMPLLAFEGYKWLILSGTVLILAAAGWFTRNLTYDSAAYYSADKNIDRMYLAELHGPVSDETVAYLQKARDALEEFYGDRADFDASLSRVNRYIEETKALAEQEGFEAWILDDTFLKNVLDRGAAKTMQQNGLIAMTALVLCLAPLFALEQTNGMNYLLKSSPKGRKGIIVRKYFLSALAALLVWAFVYGREILCLLRIYPKEMMGISGHNIILFRDLPVSFSFGGALTLYFALSFLTLLSLVHICLFFSEYAGSADKAMIAGAAALLLPAAAYYLGAGWMAPLSLLPFLAEDHLLLAEIPKRLLFAAWFALSLLSLAWVGKRWKKC